jgi:hypothetical protein
MRREELMKHLSLFCVLALTLAAAPAFAQVGQGLSGPHYNLTIIGVSNPKKVDMTDTSRHTIFVPLSGSTKISYVAGETFQVLDGNCTDSNGCTIEVPSAVGSDLCYNVYSVGLGKPGGYSIVTAECLLDGTLVGGGTCTEALLQGSFEVDRTNNGSNKPLRHNISDVFRATGCLDLDNSGTCNTGDVQFTNAWIFNIDQLLSYWWDYNNAGLRNMQVRFYQTTCGSISTVQ